MAIKRTILEKFISDEGKIFIYMYVLLSSDGFFIIQLKHFNLNETTTFDEVPQLTFRYKVIMMMVDDVRWKIRFLHSMLNGWFN